MLLNEEKAAAMRESTSTISFSHITYEQIAGALLGAAVGDALGWPYEQNAARVGPRVEPAPDDTYQGWRRRIGGRFGTHELAIQPGAYSDDTQLILATARALLTTPKWGTYLSNHELPLWLLYQRGGGGATKRAAESWLRHEAPWTNSKLAHRYYQAGGNGVAMRILPHLFVPGQSAPQLMRDVLRNGILTHGHPRALLGARLYALAGWWVAQQRREILFGELVTAMLAQEEIWAQPPEQQNSQETNSRGWLESADQYFPNGYLETWHGVVGEIREGLRYCERALAEGILANHEEHLRRLGCFSRENGSGVVAALAAIYLFSAHASNPMAGLRTIVYARGTDTDTIASMVGGLFGLSHRIEWIPDQLRRVQDHALLEHIAQRFASSELGNQPPPDKRWHESDAKLVTEQLRQGATQVWLGALGAAHVTHQRPLLALKHGSPGREWELTTEAGQTVYITYTPRGDASRSEVRRRSAENEEKLQARANSPMSQQRTLNDIDDLFPEPMPSDSAGSDSTLELNPAAAAATLEKLAELLGDEVSARSALLLATHILRTPPMSIAEAHALVDRYLPNLTNAQRKACLKVVERIVG